ncbi:MAG: peptidoglycan DD-metalloendopeptidase family protein [Candidatus Pacebacteria bacterium]|nr:peptidoglycan DD-metalloendopeptidase family protein [Candidatus Paceibacterota bacterium]
MKINLIIIKIIIFVWVIFPVGIGANEIDTLKSKISEKSIEMQKIEEEIDKWEKELDVVGKEKKSLNNEIYYLNTTENKLKSNISLTTNQIYSTGLKIEKLGIEIEEKKDGIEINSSALSEALQIMNEQETYSMLEVMLVNNSLSDFWNDLEDLQTIQARIKDKTQALKELKTGLEKDKTESEEQKVSLSSYKVELGDRKEIVYENKKIKNQLLDDTKNKEVNYQKILDEKLALRKAFQAELREYEDQLRMAVDPGSIPEAGFSILSWPVNKVYITQFFGNTPFATKNPQVYGDGGHNGVDFRASIGTKLKTALSGTVVAIGNTDDSCPHASYGKWVFVRHNNGLSTIYAHLSKITVVPGQVLITGDMVGYSGNTGYSTGPHLHFGVYATQGVEVKTYNFRSCSGKSTIMPLVTRRDAYLNPLSYLPEYK